MNIRVRGSELALGLLVLSGSIACQPAWSTDTAGAPVSTKRQISECMSRRMASSHTVSYNDASKLCKDQVKAQASTTGVSPTGKSVGAH